MSAPSPASCNVMRRAMASRSEAPSDLDGDHKSIPWLHGLTRPGDAPSAPQHPPPRDVDAIIVLAGGQTTSGSGLPSWVERRLDLSLGLQRLQKKKCPILCLGTCAGIGILLRRGKCISIKLAMLSPPVIVNGRAGGGTPHKPPILTPTGYVIHESTACAAYLQSRGLEPEMLLKEVSSYDTVRGRLWHRRNMTGCKQTENWIFVVFSIKRLHWRYTNRSVLAYM